MHTQIERDFQADPSSSLGIKVLQNRLHMGITTLARVRAASSLGNVIAQKMFPEEQRLNDLTETLNLLSQKERVAFACDCAERVLPLFEEVFPEDKRPREALAVIRKKDSRASAEAESARAAAWAAESAWVARAAAAESAARASAWAADLNAAQAAWAARAAVRAAARAAARAESAAAAGADELKWQKQKLCEYLLGEIKV